MLTITAGAVLTASSAAYAQARPTEPAPRRGSGHDEHPYEHDHPRLLGSGSLAQVAQRGTSLPSITRKPIINSAALGG